MSAIRCFFLFTLIGFNAFCQFDCLFQKQGHSNIRFQSVIEDFSKRYYLILSNTPTFSIGSTTSGNYWQILKIDNHGNLIDSTFLDSSFTAHSQITIFDKYYYITGAYKGSNSPSSVWMPTILKLDSNLNIVKLCKLDSVPGLFPFMPRIVQINKRIYLGYYDLNFGGAIKLFKLDQNLSKLDSTILTGDILQDLKSSDSKILISGYGFSQGSIFGNLQIAHMDTTFSIISRFNVDSLSYINGCGQKIGINNWSGNIYPVDSNKYIVVGHSPVTSGVFPCTTTFKIITSLIKNNNQVMQTTISNVSGFHSRFTEVNYTGSSKYGHTFSVAYIVSPNLFSNPSVPLNYCTRILIEKTNTLGGVVWSKVIGGDKYYLPIDITATSDSGFVIYGMRYDTINPIITNVAQAFVLKFDKFGAQEFVSIIENSNNTGIYALCYPNPIQDIFYFDIPFCKEAEIRIYNSLGTLCLALSNYTPNSKISTQSLSSGVYYCQVLTTRGSSIKKLIIN